MAVRFQCGFCSQPIEVDDEWASKAVACPYCRKTITAPAESTLGELGGIPTATRLPPTEHPTPHPPPVFEPSGAAPVPPPNGIALVAFALACGMLVLVACLLGVLATHTEELAAFAKPEATISEQMQALTEYVESQGGVLPGWLFAVSFLELGAGMLWIAAVVCGIVGVRHPRRRRLAVASLIITGLTPILLCCGSGAVLAPYT